MTGTGYKVIHWITALLSVAAAPAAFGQAWQDTLPELDNYAWAFPVSSDEPASFYRTPLPYEVYVFAADPQLRDLGVYNAAGQALPRTVEPAAGDDEAVESRRTLPFAAQFRDGAPDPERIRLVLERRAGETVLELQGNPPGDGARLPPVSAYIVDLRGFDDAIDTLELTWPPLEQGFVGRVQVDGSTNLVDWSRAGSGAVADLRENGTDIIKRRVTVSSGEFDFLRLTWTGLPADWRLDRLDALQQDLRETQPREWLALTEVGKDPDDGGRLYDALGPVPVDRVNLLLPETNSVVRARIYARLPQQNAWTLVHHGTFFNVQRGELPATSSPESVNLRRAQQWKVIISGGHPETPLELDLGWRPDTLLFIAQGDPPYTLAVGREDAETELFPEERLLGEVSLGGIATDNGPIGTATLGERYALAGIARRQPLNWRTLLLWLVLVGAVASVAWMAFRLNRGLSSA